MQFRNTEGGLFEIPTEWCEAAGAPNFVQEPPYCYEVSPDTGCRVVLVSEVAPPKRKPGLKGFSKDGFAEEKMVSILRAFRDHSALPPIEVNEISAGHYRYKVYDGVHRCYASVAAGFSHLPVTIKPDVQSCLDAEEAAGAKTEHLKIERAR
jgi:hypothetical protein